MLGEPATRRESIEAMSTDERLLSTTLDPPTRAALQFTVQVHLEEYKSLREEIMRSIQVQQAHLSFGSAISGAVLAAAAAFFSHNHAVASAVLVLGLPVVTYLTLFLWLSELLRMFRVGRFLRQAENDINTLMIAATGIAGARALSWENWIHDPSRRSARRVEDWQVLPVIAGFMAISVTSTVLGYCVWWRDTNHAQVGLKLAAITGSAMALTLTSVLLAHLCRAILFYRRKNSPMERTSPA